MIKINLTPVEELENPYWWAPDLSIALVLILLSLGGVYLYVSGIESEIAGMETEKERMITEGQNLSGDVERFNGLNLKIEQLESKKTSLKRITESKLVRFLPIILLENIQNLKPDGVWLTSLGFVDRKAENPAELLMPTPVSAPPAPADAKNPEETHKPKPASAPLVDGVGRDYPFIIEIVGSALDNIQIAEFMMALKATQNQIYEKSDLRTQLFFSDVAINFSQISTRTEELKDKSKSIVNFKLQLNSRERIGNSTEKPGKFTQFIDEFRRNGQAIMN